MPVLSETQPFGSELHQPCAAKRKAEFLEPPTSLKEAVRELKHVEQNRNPGAYLNKAKPTCSRPQSSIEVDAERTDIDIAFVDQIPDSLSNSWRLSMLGGVASILIVAVPLWPRTRTLPLPKCALKTLLSMRLRCAAIAISPNVSTTVIFLMPARIQRLTF